jgi:hypothetical protein
MRVRRFQIRLPTRSVDGRRRAGSRVRYDIGIAMLKIMRMRCQVFRSRFGRDPGPDDPLFFDSTHDQPVIAVEAEMRSQVMDAATATRCDFTSVMKFLGLG